MTIRIDRKRDGLLAKYAIGMLKEFYMKPGEKSPQEAFRRASLAWSRYNGKTDMELAKRLYGYASRKWFMFASPVLSNAPCEKAGAPGRGLPISCFLSYVPDTLEGLIEHTAELRWLSIYGGGVGGHWSDVRTVSDIAPGPIPFLHTVDADMTAYKQGKTRKGSYAAYLDVSHPDVMEFINIRIPTGDVQRKALNIHNAVNVTDEFMSAVESDSDFDLKDPKDGSVKETVKARKLWERILEIRFRTGEPYLHFIDASNRALPPHLKKLGLRINGSNLCNEITLPTDASRTAVCCLSSLNLEYYDEWKDAGIVGDLIRMLDNVLQYFIDNAPSEVERARRSAERERSVGLGAMGFHSLLQKRGVAWESEAAREVNMSVFSHVKSEAEKETRLLAKERGECPDGKGTGLRNSHLLAIAPNASSGVILSTSPSIEPLKANAYTHRTRSGSFLVKNKHLKKLLKGKGEDSKSTWNSIIVKKGSVQHLPFLTEEEKSVFKTADELDQSWVVRHAADRQPFICQSQSVNLFFPGEVDKSYVNRVHYEAWRAGLKGLYYLRTEAKSRAETVSEKIERVALKDDNRTIVYGKPDCPYCSMAKEELRLRGIEFDYINLEEAGKTAAEVTGRKVKTVPQIYVEGVYVGGWNELMEHFSGKEEEREDECLSCSG